MNRHVVSTLKKAIDKIEKGWIKHALAVDAKGEVIMPGSKKACKWCMLGAITGSTKSRIVLRKCKELLYLAIHDGPSGSIIRFNDTARSKKVVLGKMRKALKLAEKQES